MAKKTTEQIKKEMAANSAAWHTADAATKKKLEAANQELGKQIGGSYNSASGTWSDSSGGSLYGGSSSGGGGSSSSGGSSGGGSYSQYTAPSLGDTWDANTDYQAIINQAVGAGDYVTAAKAEQLRNQKITALGISNYSTTNKYAGWLDNTDYSTIGKNQMANGASWEDVLDTYNKRFNKANGTEGLQQYANDELQNMMLQYINQQKALEQAQDQLDEYEQDRPEDYQSKYDPQIEALLNGILNRDDFSYDVMNDPLYQQYADAYRREGDRAMRNTLAEVATGAGGMNSYAITAAQQANNNYIAQLNDKIPELYQLAYEMYINDKESKVQDLGILQGMDATQYNRYRDTINDFYTDRNFAYNAYQNAVTQGNWQTNFDYNSKWDNINYNNDNYWKNKEWDYNDYWNNKEYTDNRGDIEYERNQTDKDSTKDIILTAIENGATTIDPALIEKAGLTQEEVNLLITAAQAQLANKSKSSVGGDKPKPTDDDTGDDTGDDKPIDNPTGNPTGNENYTKIEAACNQMISEGDEWGAAACAKEAVDKGFITKVEYDTLLRKNNPLLKTILLTNYAASVPKE